MAVTDKRIAMVQSAAKYKAPAKSNENVIIKQKRNIFPLFYALPKRLKNWSFPKAPFRGGVRRGVKSVKSFILLLRNRGKNGKEKPRRGFLKKGMSFIRRRRSSLVHLFNSKHPPVANVPERRSSDGKPVPKVIKPRRFSTTDIRSSAMPKLKPKKRKAKPDEHKLMHGEERLSIIYNDILNDPTGMYRETQMMELEEARERRLVHARAVYKAFFDFENWEIIIPIYQYLDFHIPAFWASVCTMFECASDYYYWMVHPIPRPIGWLHFQVFRKPTLISEICSFLPNRDCSALSESNRHFHHALDKRPLEIHGAKQADTFFIMTHSRINSRFKGVTVLRLGNIDKNSLKQLKFCFDKHFFSMVGALHITNYKNVDAHCTIMQDFIIKVLLLQCNFLSALTLQSCGINPSVMSAIAKVLSTIKLPKLKYLNFSDNPIGQDGYECLAFGVHYNCFENLTKIALRDTSIDDNASSNVCTVLSHFQHVTTLDISKNCIGYEGVRNISNLLKQKGLPALLNLNFCANTASKTALQELYLCLNEGVCSNLKYLNLNGNIVGQDGCRQLGHALQNGCCLGLNNFQLSACHITSDGLKLLSDVFSGVQLGDCLPNWNGTQLTELNFSRNNIGNGIYLLCEAISKQHLINLVRLNLAGNGFGVFAFRKLAESLGIGFQCLKFLDLSENEATADGILQFLRFFRSPTAKTLWKLDLHRNLIDSCGLLALSTALRTSNFKQLHEIDISHNGIFNKMVHIYDTIRAFPIACFRIGEHISRDDGIKLVKRANSMKPASIIKQEKKEGKELDRILFRSQQEANRTNASLSFAMRQSEISLKYKNSIDQALSGHIKRGAPISKKHAKLQTSAKIRKMKLNHLLARQANELLKYPKESIDYVERKRIHASECYELEKVHTIQRYEEQRLL